MVEARVWGLRAFPRDYKETPWNLNRIKQKRGHGGDWEREVEGVDRNRGIVDWELLAAVSWRDGRDARELAAGTAAVAWALVPMRRTG